MSMRRAARGEVRGEARGDARGQLGGQAGDEEHGRRRAIASSDPTVDPILILLGSNIAPRRNLIDAVDRLSEWFDVKAVSRIFATKAVGSDGPDFLNAAVQIGTTLAPCAIQFDALRTIEAQLGRLRSADPNAPRTIDLDLVVYGQSPLAITCQVEGIERRIILPDPDACRVPHMLFPLADIAPGFRLGGADSETLAGIAAAMSGKMKGAMEGTQEGTLEGAKEGETDGATFVTANGAEIRPVGDLATAGADRWATARRSSARTSKP